MSVWANSLIITKIIRIFFIILFPLKRKQNDKKASDYFIQL